MGKRWLADWLRRARVSTISATVRSPAGELLCRDGRLPRVSLTGTRSRRGTRAQRRAIFETVETAKISAKPIGGVRGINGGFVRALLDAEQTGHAQKRCRDLCGIS